MRSFERIIPIKNVAESSIINSIKNSQLNSEPLTKVFATDKHIAKSNITNTSIITVTPIAIFVNLPLARSSLIIAMADDGERATKIVPVSIAMAIILF